MTDDEDNVLDLSVKKSSDHHANLSSLPSPPSSSTSSSSVIVSPKSNLSSSSSSNKRMLETANSIKTHSQSGTIPSNNKRPLRFQCKHCDYKAPSTSLMQNHIYRHTDLTPYACAHCGHKSTTKSTIMVHIELCHPNMEVKIIENRVREQDFYCDLNSSDISTISHVNTSTSTISSTKQEPQMKKVRRSNQYDSESAPINGVAISLKNLDDEENESSRASDEISETENLEPLLFDDVDEQIHDPSIFDAPPTMAKPPLKFKLLSQPIPIVESTTSKESESDGKFHFQLHFHSFLFRWFRISSCLQSSKTVLWFSI